jgi:putative endonuclease
MSLWHRLKEALNPSSRVPQHLRRGRLGERTACDYLTNQGMRLLMANFRSHHGEIDLILRDQDCVAFVEVKTRSREEWIRPAAAVNLKRQRRLSRAALDYLQQLRNPPVKFRFDIVEVLLSDDEVQQIRHLPNAFPLAYPYRYR